MSQQKRDYYEVLGIDKTADPATIKKAYRKLAKKYHPDSNVGNAAAAEKFKEVNEAYDILSDPEKKKLYDQFGHAAFDGTGAAGAGFDGANGGFGTNGHFSGGFGGFSDAGGFHGFGGSGTHTYHFEGGEGDDIFGDIFENMFGGGKKSSFHQGASGFNGFHHYSGGFGADAASEKGSDAQAEINISFDDAAFGVDRVITLSGTDGSRQNLQIHIPAGIGDGQSIRLKGKGSYVQCNTNGEYRMLSGVFGPSSQFDSALLARVTVYGDDDQVLYTSPDIHYNEKNVYFGVDVSGQKQIRVEVSLLKDNEWDDPVILFDGLSLYK